MIVIVKDAASAVSFYGELQKRLTDYMKRILGVEHLRLWEGRAAVVRLRGVNTLISRIAYLYANPARANLVDRIEDYPGLSSWRALLEAESFDSRFCSYIPWIRLPAVPKIGARRLTRREDRKVAQELLTSSRTREVLEIEPNAWMCYLRVEEKDLKRINEDILTAVRAAENEARRAREKQGKKPLGAAVLREAAIMRSHTPKRKERQIFVISEDQEDRMLFIEGVKALLDYCKILFRKRLFHLWPPGVFLPPAGLKASAVDLT